MKRGPGGDQVKEMASGCLAARLRILNRSVTRLYDDALRPHGVRVSQLNILVLIAAAGPIRGTDVAAAMHLDKSTLSRDLDRMFERGWVRALPGVGRARPLEATDAGRKLIATVTPAWRSAQREARKLLTPALADGMAAVVDAMWEGLEAGEG